MASTKEIKRRIKLVKTTSQITRAMELVAATKMRSAEAAARTTREYARRASEILSRLMDNVERGSHPLLLKNSAGKMLVLVITPDRGLAGAITGNVLREAVKIFAGTAQSDLDIMAIGKRGQDFLRKAGYNIIAAAMRLDWKPHIFDIRPFARIAIEGYLEEKYKTVLVVFPNFISPSVQRPKVETLLPFSNQNRGQESHLRQGSGGQASVSFQYLIEPSPQAVLDSVLRNLIEMRIYQALLEGNASEHSARMIAMHSATENAKELNSDLTLTYNQIRQESITREIAEISAGANA